MDNKYQYSFDIFEKYSMVADIIKNETTDNQKITVLEIGGRGDLLKEFLPNAEIFILDNELVSKSPHFILGDATKLEFSDNHFDFIVSCDVLEHIPLEEREEYIREHYRCAKKTSIFIAPFSGSENEKLEADVLENYMKLSGGEDYRWLREHKINGLPKLADIIDILNKNKITYDCVPLGDSNIWHFMINLSHLIVFFNWKYEDVYKEFNEINEYFNRNISLLNRGEMISSPYRYAFILSKNKGNSSYINPPHIGNKLELSREMSKRVWGIITNLLVEKSKEFSELNKKYILKEKKIQEITSRNVDLEEQIKLLEMEILHKDKQLEEQQKQFINEINDLSTSITSLKENIDELQLELAEKQSNVEQLYQLIQIYESSTSWKVTKPLRSAGKIVKDIPMNLKYLIKKSINAKDYLVSNKMLNLGELLNKRYVEKFNTFSFDMFDTLVFRKVDPPECIHQSTANYIKELLLEEGITGITIDYILKIRYERESILRGQSFEAGKDYECGLFGILFETLTNLRNEDFANKYTNKVINYEISSEKKVLYPNPEAIPTLKALKEQGKRIIIVSDMYLAKEDLIEILNSCNLMQYIDEVYVSSFYGYSKGTGRLFKKLIEDKILKSNETLHIGDNFISDYKMPKNEEIYSLWYFSKNNNKRRKKIRKMIENGSILDIVNELSKEDTESDLFYKLGKEVIGPVFTLYIQHVIDTVREKQIDEIFFLAREGYLFQKIYDDLKKSEKYKDSQLPDGKYTYISRLSSSLPSVYSFGLREVRMGLWKINQKGLYSILTTFNIDPEKFKSIAREYGIQDIKSPIFDPFNDIRLHNFLTDLRVQKMIFNQVEYERDLLSRYFEQLGFFGEGKKCAFVDIGWSGTIQHNVGRALISNPEFPKLYGIYFGRNVDAHLRYLMHPKLIFEPGFVFDFEHNNNYLTKAIMEFPQLFEQAATAPHGSTVGYKEENNRVMPMLKTTSSEDRKQEMKQFEMINKVQQGIQSFVKSYSDFSAYLYINTDIVKNNEIKKLNEFITNPKLKFVHAIEKLYHSEDWGTQNILKIVSPDVSRRTLFNPKLLVKELRESFWKQGTLKKTKFPGIVTFFNAFNKFRKKK